MLRVRRQTEDTINSTRPTYSTIEGNELDWDDCEICMTPTTRRCSICNKGFFCSDLCQEKRSGAHLFTCSKRPLTSADYLWRSLAEDVMPEDEDVLVDFRFNSVPFGGDQTYLLGLYRGLYLSGKFSAEDIHEWRIGGILVNKIKEFYYSIPENSRGRYFPWFLKNSHALERHMTKDEAQQNLIATFYDKAKPYLDIEDRNKTARELQPEARGTSYNLLAGVLSRCSPNPIERNWYTFGFVTCRDLGEEAVLVDVYQLLLTESDGSFFYEFHNSRRGVIEPVTFTQFWKAYEAGTLIHLMDSKGLKELRSRFPFLDGFLSMGPGGPLPSVWNLKQFIEINNPIDYPPIPSVNADYGFINCRTFEETCILMEIYSKVLKNANPLELHQACVAGDLFRFASGCVRMEEQWRPLMRNFYPFEEAVESELGQEAERRSEVGSETKEDSTGLPSLLSRIWGFINRQS